MKSWCFEKISKIDKPFTKSIISKKEKTKTCKTRDKRQIITDSDEIQKILRTYPTFYSTKLEI